MDKKGWYEIRSNNDCFDICIFSIDFRVNNNERDSFFPDITLPFEELNTGEWFVSKMVISNPAIEEFTNLAIEILKKFQDHDPSTLKEVITLLDEFLLDKIPTELEKMIYMENE